LETDDEKKNKDAPQFDFENRPNKQKVKVLVNDCQTIECLENDITMEKADAIVTPANKWLVPGADDDVYFSVIEKAGEEVEKECSKWVMDKGILDAGQIAVT
jgi:hypothetical protein